MQNIKKIASFSILFFFVLECPYSYAAESIAIKATTSSIETVAGEKTLEKLSVAGPYVSVVVQVYYIGQEIRKHNFPTEEERAHAFEVSEKYAFISAENEFQRCLMENRSTFERGFSGCPTACEDIARMFIMLGGKDEVNRMTTIYNQFRK